MCRALARPGDLISENEVDDSASASLMVFDRRVEVEEGDDLSSILSRKPWKASSSDTDADRGFEKDAADADDRRGVAGEATPASGGGAD